MRGVEQIPWLYDLMCTLAEWTGFARWRRWLVEGGRGRTLEIGSGTGRNLARYAELPLLVALEFDADALEAAKKRRGQALLVRGSAQALPFREGAFDTVVSSLVFCSVPAPEGALGEVKRVMAADGQLRMLEHVRSDGWYGRVQDFIQPAWTRIAGGCHPNRRTEETVARAGFTLSEQRANGTMRRFVARRS